MITLIEELVSLKQISKHQLIKEEWSSRAIHLKSTKKSTTLKVGLSRVDCFTNQNYGESHLKFVRMLFPKSFHGKFIQRPDRLGKISYSCLWAAQADSIVHQQPSSSRSHACPPSNKILILERSLVAKAPSLPLPIKGAFWEPLNHWINHLHALVMSLRSSIKSCISLHSSGMPHSMNMASSKSLCMKDQTSNSDFTWHLTKAQPSMAPPEINIAYIDCSSCNASSHITCIKVNIISHNTNREYAHPLSQRTLPVW